MDTNPLLERILREAGTPELLDILAERLSPTDVQSLLLAVYRQRAKRTTPGQLLDQYTRDRFVHPVAYNPTNDQAIEQLIWSLLQPTFLPLELAPLCPLGTQAAVATVDQNKVVTTIRNTEVVADVTNVLALECALRRRALLHAQPRSHERVRLGAIHRVVRAQAYDNPHAQAHFRLLGLCSAGRDEGSFRFETTSLVEHITCYYHLLRQMSQLGSVVRKMRLAITPLDAAREQALTEQVIAYFQTAAPDLRCELDRERSSGRGYYIGACFHLYATNQHGQEYELVDGGFTTWTRQLLSNQKERLLISGMGIDRLAGQFGAGSR